MSDRADPLREVNARLEAELTRLAVDYSITESLPLAGDSEPQAPAGTS